MKFILKLPVIMLAIIISILPKSWISMWRDSILRKSIRIHPDGAYAVRGGFVHNPLKRYPRNFRCFCGKMVKAKDCCLPEIAPVCSPKEALVNRLAVKWAEKLTGESDERSQESIHSEA